MGKAFDVAFSTLKGDFYIDPANMRSGGQYTGPQAKVTTSVPDHKKRAEKGWRKFTAGKKVWDEWSGPEDVTYDADPSSANSVVEGDAFTDSMEGGHLGPEYRTDLQPYSEQELIDRGRDATPETAEFRRGGSQPRTNRVTTDTPSKSKINYKDAKGQDIYGYDQTGKKYLKNNSNLPRQFKGQEREYATHLGVNLASRGHKQSFGYHGTEPELNSMGMKWRDGEDDAIEGITSTLAHESAHEAIDQDLKDAINTGELPARNYNVAHEIGAHTLQHFGDEKKVNEDLKTHPSTGAGNHGIHTPKQFKQTDLRTGDRKEGERQIKMPKPIEASVKKACFDHAWRVVKTSYADAEGVGEAPCPECNAMAMVIREGPQDGGRLSLACSDCGYMDGGYGE
ncbi:MAG: hypothetical protein CL524_00670 [Aequorivita sp.]|nr:hypothetical protein [Aequorivita sp.]